MYIFIYIYIYICVCICIYIYIYIYIYIHIHIHILIYAYVCVFMSILMLIYILVFMYILIFTYINVYIYVNIYLQYLHKITKMQRNLPHTNGNVGSKYEVSGGQSVYLTICYRTLSTHVSLLVPSWYVLPYRCIRSDVSLYFYLYL